MAMSVKPASAAASVRPRICAPLSGLRSAISVRVLSASRSAHRDERASAGLAVMNEGELDVLVESGGTPLRARLDEFERPPAIGRGENAGPVLGTFEVEIA